MFKDELKPPKRKLRSNFTSSEKGVQMCRKSLLESERKIKSSDKFALNDIPPE
jgi:hypothetical protein